MADEVTVEVPDSQANAINGSTTTDTVNTNGQSESGHAVENAAPPATSDDSNPTNAEATSDLPADAAEPDNANDGVDAPTNGTPATSKTQKRKSSNGVPEHKSRKLNKKKSTPQLSFLDAKPGDYCWAKFGGKVPWPALVCSEVMLIPAELLMTRPVSAERQDGTYREDYADGGKNVKDRQFAVMFFGANNFSWIKSSLMSKLDLAECEGYENKKLSKPLMEAYKAALEGHDLAYYENVIREQQEEEKKFAEENAQRELDAENQKKEKAAAKEATKKKTARKSKGSDPADMDVDDTAETEVKPSKKRKKDADSDGEQPQAKKSTKVKLSTPKASKETPAKKSTKGKKSAKAEAAAPEDGNEEDEADEDEAPLSAEDQEQLRVQFEKAILYLRHKLQKGFLSREIPPKEEDMPQMAEHFTQLEKYPEIDAQVIRTTKIHKVLKTIMKLPEIPKNDEYNFKKRCTDLLSSWDLAMTQDSVPPSAIEPKEGKSVNGMAKAEDTGATKTDMTKGEGEAAAQDKKPSVIPDVPEKNGQGGPDEAEPADVSMTDVAKDDKLAPGSEEKRAEETGPNGDEDTKALESNAGDAAA